MKFNKFWYGNKIKYSWINCSTSCRIDCSLCSRWKSNSQVPKIGAVEESGFSQSCVETGCYTPSVLTIKSGTIVTMTNTDTTGVHTFTSGTVDGFTPNPTGIFDSGVLMSGDSFEWQANLSQGPSGTIPYYCMLHTWMIGTITVN